MDYSCRLQIRRDDMGNPGESRPANYGALGLCHRAQHIVTVCTMSVFPRLCLECYLVCILSLPFTVRAHAKRWKTSRPCVADSNLTRMCLRTGKTLGLCALGGGLGFALSQVAACWPRLPENARAAQIMLSAPFR
jgi:hypothetical protein